MWYTKTMSAQTSFEWSWLKRVEKKLYDQDEIPLKGDFPPFPFSLLEEKIRTTLKLQKFSLHASEPEWKEEKDLFTGIGFPLEIFSIQPSGIDGTVFAVVSKGDLMIIASEILKLPQDTIQTLPEKYIEQFATFISAEALFALNALKYANLSFSFSTHKEISPKAHLAQDVYIECGDAHIRLRILFSDAFRTSSIECMRKMSGKIPVKERLRSLSLQLHLEAGRTDITINDLTKLRPGDFVLIDKPIYNPSEKTPNGVIFLAGKPLFRVALQEKQAKILEIPLYHEVYGTMTNKIEIDAHDEDVSKEDVENDDNMFAPFAEEESDDDIEEVVEENPTSEDAQEENYEEEAHSTQEEPLQEESVSEESPTSSVSPTPIISPSGEIQLNQIPITIKVELAQISMSAEKLFQLQPGNMIDCQSGSNIAYLVVDDIIIGKGEIIKIGDNIGIRVLEIAAHE